MNKDNAVDEFLLKVDNLQVQFRTEEGIVQAVDGVSFYLRPGEALGIVGESGCGKSVTSRAIMRLIDPPGKIIGGSVLFKGKDLLTLPESEMVRIRGGKIAMIFQQPQSALDPVIKVGSHIAETLNHHCGREHQSVSVLEQTTRLLQMVEIPDVEDRVKAYAHELSGGMAQRIMISIALACDPDLLIADEPTTALDVTIQAQILNLIKNLRRKFNTSTILITHDLGIVATMTDRVAVMYAGQLVEELNSEELFSDPLHPYTQGLIRSKPILGQDIDQLEIIEGNVPTLINLPGGCRFAPRCKVREELGLSICTEVNPPLEIVKDNHQVRCWLYSQEKITLGSHNQNSESHIQGDYLRKRKTLQTISVSPENDHEHQKQDRRYSKDTDLIRVENLIKYYPLLTGFTNQRKGWVHAVDDISFTIREGETLGMVGESGCGKTTVGRTIIRQIPASSGNVYFEGKNIFKVNRQDLNKFRRNMQYIFQNPYASLDPHMKVEDIIAEGLLVQGMKNAVQRRSIVMDIIQKVGLREQSLHHYPHEFSGGQRQRIGIARALAVKPRFLICDEPVSALDVSVQSQVLNLLNNLQKEFHLTYLFISHDLSVVEHMADRVAVMYLGKLVELAEKYDLYRSPLHPYTQALMAAIPNPKAQNNGTGLLKGDLPSPTNPPPGCRFASRCPLAQKECLNEIPVLQEVSPGHWVACLRVGGSNPSI